LMLINLSDPSEDRHGFCRKIRKSSGTQGIPIVSIGVADTARARFAAIDAGADDVLPRPISDVLLLARIRSLMRRRNVAQELQLRDDTSRALGFDEETAPRLSPARISVLSDTRPMGARLVADLQAGLSQSVRLITSVMAHSAVGSLPNPDVMIIDGTTDNMTEDAVYALVSDLGARRETRFAAQMVVVPDDRPDMAAMLLDLGAHDVVFESVSAAELTLRTQQLVALKTRQDSLRDRVRNGLHAAVTDPLTGLFNRRYAETHLKRIAEQSRESGCDYALMVLESDHFKSVNDTYGHAAGDLVLTQLAQRLGRNFRSIDLVARIGGEEFLVAMPNTTTEQAQMAAERVLRLVQARDFDLGDTGPAIKLTISVGVAVDAADDASLTPAAILFEQADAALYDAKSSGRNTIRMSRVAA